MTDKIIVVTQPDDYYEDAIRFLFVDLDSNQTKLFNKPLLEIPTDKTIVCYYWAYSNSEEWLLDKILKSQIIFFNNDSEYRELVGYLKANKKAYGLGTDRFLNGFVNRTINDQQEIKTLILKLPDIDL